MRRYIVDNYLHTYLDKSLDENVARKGMLSRMSMRNGLAFLLDVFEAIRVRKLRWRDPNAEVGCDFHDHKDGEACSH